MCDLPPDLLRPLVGRWHEGAGPRVLRRYLRELDPTEKHHISENMLSNCFNRAKHHGNRGDAGSQDKLAADRLGRIRDLLERSGIEPEDIGQVKAIRLSEWQGLTKDKNDEAQIHDLQGASVLLSPEWAEGPRWPVVQQAAPTVVKPAPTVKRRTPDGWHTAVILPDPQIGFRRDLDTMELDPFHDHAAIDVAMQIVRHVDPDDVVWLGDFLDLPMFGTFVQEPGFAHTVQQTVDEGHRILARACASAPRAKHRLLEGNHDARLQKFTLRNALAAFGLRRGDQPDGWPVLSVPYLLALDQLGVEYLPGYPANEVWLNENLRAVHGLKVRSAGSTAAAVIDDERVSTLFGHVHRIELQHRTRHTFGGKRTSLAATPGCLCRIDGSVPSTKSGIDLLGRPLTSWENWQQGLAVVTYEPGDGRFHLELVPIHDGWAAYRGREFVASATKEAA